MTAHLVTGTALSLDGGALPRPVAHLANLDLNLLVALRGLLGIRSRIAVRAESYLAGPHFVAGTDRIALMQERLAAVSCRDGRIRAGDGRLTRPTVRRTPGVALTRR